MVATLVRFFSGREPRIPSRLARFGQTAAGLVLSSFVVFGLAGWLSADERARALEFGAQPEVVAARLAQDAREVAAARIAAGAGWFEELDGARWSPPLDVHGHPRPELAGWTQSLLLVRSGAPAQDGAAAGEAIELVVGVTREGVKAGTYRWWFEPEPADDPGW